MLDFLSDGLTDRLYGRLRNLHFTLSGLEQYARTPDLLNVRASFTEGNSKILQFHLPFPLALNPSGIYFFRTN
jgi:hypothetical protein